MKYSCYYIIHLGCLMGFTMHFYIIFGTNLLTQSPVPVSVFPLFQCFAEKEYQTESKRNETLWRSYFWKESNPRDLESTSRKQRGRHEAAGRAHPPGRALHPRGPLVAPLTDFFRLYMSTYPKTSRTENRLGVPLPQASIATKNLSGAHSGALPEGEPITGGHLHHPGTIHEEGVVHPRG